MRLWDGTLSWGNTQENKALKLCSGSAPAPGKLLQLHCSALQLWAPLQSPARKCFSKGDWTTKWRATLLWSCSTLQLQPPLQSPGFFLPFFSLSTDCGEFFLSSGKVSSEK
uniref:Uncharacterized protein n=1 Tax=Chelonoidis abingdonii TaxID=106734 RepID=A0A8C0HD83_CHEAB